MASSDATNIRVSIVREGDEYVINGRKWWTSGAGDPRCKIAIFMGKTDPSAPPHKQQSMILVPMDARGVKIERLLTVFGYDHAPHGHGEVTFDECSRAGVEYACWVKAVDSKLRKDASGRAEFITACAASASPSALLKRCANECSHAWPSESRWPNRARFARTLRLRESRSSRRVCLRSRPLT